MPEDPRFIGEIADGAREASLAALLILALAIPVFTAWLSIRTLSDRGPIVCYVPEVDYKPVITNSPESP